MRQHTVVKAFFCAIICATISSLHRFTSTFGLASMASLAAVTALLASPSAQAQYSATPTSFSVTDAGASSFSIPIYTPPMPGGMDVKLSLQYNSQARNGVFGVGWNLSGVSSITRCPKTIAEEGERIGVKNDATDVFCLDGQKLRAVAGVYGAAGTEYRTAIDSYSQIISNGNHWGGPLGFTVKTKSGAIMEFGGLYGTDLLHNSNLEHPAKKIIRVWMLRSIKDRFNNTISFTYDTDSNLGEQRLRFLDFNNNGYLEINYQDRGPSDAILKYDDGVQMGSTRKRANKIVISDSPVQPDGSRSTRPFKEYRLNYSQSTTTQRSLLSSVQECAGDGACLPAVTMDYNSAGQVAFTPGAALPDAQYYNLVDNEGNGKPQVVYNLANAPSGGALSVYNVQTWDIDNDSKTDYVIDQTTFQSNNRREFRRSRWLSSTKVSETLLSIPDLNGVSVPSICYADLNGDGASDEIKFSMGFRPNDRSPHTYYVGSSLGGAILVGSTNTGGNSGEAPLDWNPICQNTDIDGDGKAELVFSIPRGMSLQGWTNFEPRAKYMITFKNGALQLSSAFRIGGFDTNATPPKLEKFGDFNGDGKTDILYLQGDACCSNLGAPSRAKIAYFASDNVAQIAESGVMSGPSINEYSGGILCTADFDGDGKTDVLSTGVNGTSYALHLTRSNQFQIVPINLPVGIAQGPVICADFDGNGLADVFYNKQYWYNTLPVAPDALKSASNGLGHYYSVDYSSITDNAVYTKYSGEVLPRVDLQTPIPVVRYVTDNAGVGPVRTRYQYYGLKADLKRRGTLGFNAVQSINEGTNPNTINTTWYNQIWPLIGMKAAQQKHLALGASNRLLENITYGYDDRVIAAGISAGVFIELRAQVEVNQINTAQYDANDGSLMGSTTDNFAGIDALGNVGVQTHQELDASGSLTSQRITTNTYTNNTANWLIGQVSSSKTTSTNLRSLPITMVGASAGADAASQSGQPPPPPVVPLTLAQKAAMAVISNLLLAD
jgi:hypothetical protein